MARTEEKGVALIAGLGNCGDKYRRHRHNAGFWFVDRLADEFGESFRAVKQAGRACRIDVASQAVWLFKSDGYMNHSGQGLGVMTRYWKIPTEKVLVAYDELDFPVGKVRLRQGGGDAGHNGVRSSIEHIGKSFWRLRIGVGRPPSAARGADYVLSNAPAGERRETEARFDEVVALLPRLVRGEFDEAMTSLHTEDGEGTNGL